MHAGENLPSDSFDHLAMLHFERPYSFACRLMHDRQKPEDLVRETYAKCLRGLQQSGKRQRAPCCSVRMGSSPGKVLSRLAVVHHVILLRCEVEWESYLGICTTFAIPMGTCLSGARKALDDGRRLPFQKG